MDFLIGETTGERRGRVRIGEPRAIIEEPPRGAPPQRTLLAVESAPRRAPDPGVPESPGRPRRGLPRLLSRPGPGIGPAALVLCSLLIQSCGGPPAPPRPVLYAGLRESLEDLDTSALQGVKIVIDPGHGGPYEGALGSEGLRESDVNLGVALNLWGLLSDAGAEVTLTRSTDRAVAGDVDVPLREDLLARAETANEAGADLFLSIHHNSDLSREPGTNRIETYYKSFDAGPSEDAARILHSHLSYNIGESRGGVIAGNYMVLRSCEGPAVLGEPSFISNPDVEARLKNAGVQRMEAVAYFLGVVDYFSRGVPRLECVAPAEGASTGPRPAIKVSAEPGRGSGIDPASIEILIDGAHTASCYSPHDSLITASPQHPLAGGEHSVVARARNNRGNWSRSLKFVFDVKTEPAHLTLNPLKEGGGVAGVPYPVEARAYDFNMNPVADSTQITFRSDRPAFPETTIVRSGKALCYVVPGPQGAFELEARCGSASMGMAAEPARGGSEGRVWWAFLRDQADGSPVGRAEISVDGRVVGVTNRDGFVSFSVPESEPGLWRIAAPGYEWRDAGPPVPSDALFDGSSGAVVKVLELRRAAGGLLHGVAVAIDPEGGGDDRAGQGPSGVDASWVNYEVAAALADLVEGAGGRPVLTRGRSRGASDVERLASAERAAAFRYLLISHRPMPDGERPSIGHYPGGSAGRALAEAIASSAERLLGIEAPAVREDARYALRQTSSPAVAIDMMPLNDHKTERLLSNPWNAAREAYAVYVGLLEDLDEAGVLAPGVMRFEIVLPRGKPAEGVTAAIDGYLRLKSDESGTVLVSALAPGAHLLETVLEGYSTQAREFSWPPGADEATARIELSTSR